MPLSNSVMSVWATVRVKSCWTDTAEEHCGLSFPGCLWLFSLVRSVAQAWLYMSSHYSLFYQHQPVKGFPLDVLPDSGWVWGSLTILPMTVIILDLNPAKTESPLNSNQGSLLEELIKASLVWRGEHRCTTRSLCFALYGGVSLLLFRIVEALLGKEQNFVLIWIHLSLIIIKLPLIHS